MSEKNKKKNLEEEYIFFLKYISEIKMSDLIGK